MGNIVMVLLAVIVMGSCGLSCFHTKGYVKDEFSPEALRVSDSIRQRLDEEDQRNKVILNTLDSLNKLESMENIPISLDTIPDLKKALSKYLTEYGEPQIVSYNRKLVWEPDSLVISFMPSEDVGIIWIKEDFIVLAEKNKGNWEVTFKAPIWGDKKTAEFEYMLWLELQRNPNPPAFKRLVPRLQPDDKG